MRPTIAAVEIDLRAMTGRPNATNGRIAMRRASDSSRLTKRNSFTGNSLESTSTRCRERPAFSYLV